MSIICIHDHTLSKWLAKMGVCHLYALRLACRLLAQLDLMEHFIGQFL